MIRSICIGVLMMWSLVACSQSEIGVEFQVYPTGVMPGVSYHHGLSETSSLAIRVGANIFDHRDLGVHTGEEGSGLGGSLGYKKYLGDTPSKLFWQIRSDIWFNQVDWFDQEGTSPRLDGETDIVVVQPTASIGYTFLTTANLAISPSLSFGYEWNAKTTGEPTGEGSIILLGVQVGKRF